MAESNSKSDPSKKRVVQNFLLIWCDQHGNSDSADTQNTITKLKAAVNHINLFVTPEEATKYLEKLKKEKAFLITSGAFGENLVPKIHKIPSLNSIFIFCNNVKYHKTWADNFNKVRGVFNKIEDVCESMKKSARRVDEDMLSISYVKLDKSNNFNTQNLDPSYMYTQILKNIFLTMKYEVTERNQLVAFCQEKYAGNKDELKTIDDFKKNYKATDAVRWYTKQCFLYQSLNRSLRFLEVDLILLYGFFIRDLHQELTKLHEQQVVNHKNKTFKVYRGQALSKQSYEQLAKTKGGLISFNSFLSTSIREEAAVSFIQSGAEDSSTVGIFFVITIDPNIKSNPFASIKELSAFSNEDEILFSMHTVFTINAVNPWNKHANVYQVDLSLKDNSDQNLARLTEQIEKEVGGEGQERIGHLLIKMGQFEKAEEMYQEWLSKTSDPLKRATYLHQLGVIKSGQQQYENALKLHTEAFNIRFEQLTDHDHPDIAASYSGLGLVYLHLNNYQRAIGYFRKDITICEVHRSENPTALATSYSNMGAAHEICGKFPEAIEFHKKALEIRIESLPEDHADIANSHNNLGLVYFYMDEYAQALEHYLKALNIYKIIFTPDHPTFVTIYSNIACGYRKLKKYKECIEYYNIAEEILGNQPTTNTEQLEKIKSGKECAEKEMKK